MRGQSLSTSSARKFEGMVEAKATDLLGRNSFDQFAELICEVPHLEPILHGHGGSSKLCAKLCGLVEQRQKQLESVAADVECADGADPYVGSSESFFKTLHLLASMETALSEHVPELVNVTKKWEDRTQKACHKLEQNIRVALEDGDGEVEHAFASLYSYADDSLTFGPACLSKITMGTVESALDELLQHSESQLQQLNSHLDRYQFEAASKGMQQLQALHVFFEGGFAEQVARLEQRSRLPSENVQQIQEMLANVRPESCYKLGEKVEGMVEAKATDLLGRNSFDQFAELICEVPHLEPILHGHGGSSKLCAKLCGLVEQRQKQLESVAADVECADGADPYVGSSESFFKTLHLLASMETALSEHVPELVNVTKKWEDRTQKACHKLEQNIRVALEDGDGEVEHAFASLYSYADDSLTFGPACLSKITMGTVESALDKLLQHSESQLEQLHSHLDRCQLEAASKCMQQLQTLQEQVARLEQRSGLPSEKVQQIKEVLANVRPESVHKLGEKAEGMVEAKATDLLARNSFDQFADLICQLPHLEPILHGHGGSSKLCAKLCGLVEQQQKQLESVAADVECADGADPYVGSSESFFKTLHLLASMETALSEHVPELVNVTKKWEDRTQKACHKLEQNIRVALEDGDGEVEHAFASLYSYADDSLTFGPACLSKITMGTVESALDKLLQHSESQLEQLHSHLDRYQLEAASKGMQQLQALHVFFEGGFAEQAARLEQRSGLPSEKVQQIKEVLANARPESVHKLGEKAEGMVEARATQLLERELFPKFEELIGQLPHLGMFLHGRDNPDRLWATLRELVVKRGGQVHKKIEQCWDTDDEQLFQHLNQLASISKSRFIVDLDVELRSMPRDWKGRLNSKRVRHGWVAEDWLKRWGEGTAACQTIVVELTRELINLARMHLLLHHEAFREVAADAWKLLVALLDMCGGCPRGHTLIRELDKALKPEMLHKRDVRYGSWIAQTFGHFREWRTLHFNKRVMKKSPEDILNQWELPDAEKTELKTGVLSF